MKIKQGFILRNIADNWVVVPLGQRVVDFNGIITLNETGAYLWNLILSGKSLEEMIVSLTSEFEISTDIAKKDTEEFLLSLKNHQLLEENDV